MSEQRPSLCLLLDGMLGRLAKWLRLLGYDTAYEKHADDLHLARRARAEDRVLLTRDGELSRRPGLRTLLIESEELEAQLRQVQEALGPPPDSALTRCSVCNTPIRPVSPDELVDRVPPYVLQTQETFYECPTCDRVYWAGTHLEHMRRQMEGVVDLGNDSSADDAV